MGKCARVQRFEYPETLLALLDDGAAHRVALDDCLAAFPFGCLVLRGDSIRRPFLFVSRPEAQ
jgi:hypothetical protein